MPLNSLPQQVISTNFSRSTDPLIVILLFISERTRGVEFYACEIRNMHVEKVEWKGVKQMNNIQYRRDDQERSNQAPIEIRAWQAYDIGVGRTYQWSDFETTVQQISLLRIISSKNVLSSWIIDSQERSGML